MPVIPAPPPILLEVLSKNDNLRSMKEQVGGSLNCGVQLHFGSAIPLRASEYDQQRFNIQRMGCPIVPNKPIGLLLSDSSLRLR